jgi:pimeloyl-ACP methyl ester carboxylesterase
MRLLILVGLALFALSARQAPHDGWADPSPHRSGSAVVNGVTLHYLDWGGTGEPLLLLAGLFGSAHGFDDLAPQLVQEFRVLALTRRGHGKSSCPVSGYSLATLVDDIRKYLDLMKIERVHLAGVSAGGVEAALFAARYPERVASVVYLDSAYDHSAAFEQRWAPRLAMNPVARTKLPFPPAEATASFATFRDWYVKEIGPWSPAVEADNREMYLAPDGSVKQFPAPLTIAQDVIASGMAAPPDYSAVKARGLAIFAIPTRADVPDDAGAELRPRAQEFLDEVLSPMQREQIDALRNSGANITIVELTGTTHMRFMADKEREIVQAMKSFANSKR